MEPKTEATRIIGIAKITNYEVTFESASYTIAIRECVLEASDRVEELPDYEIMMIVPFNEKQKLIHWFKTPAFIAMQESWKSNEDDCYFEHSTDTRAALIILNGTAVLIPVTNQ
jgi:hypothetical protein